jgi:steroid delta-isomerase
MSDNLFIKEIIKRFEGLSLETVDHLTDIYSTDAIFKDPFNEVSGQSDIKKIFVHMFEQVDHPKFIVLTEISNSNQACLTWEFRFRFKNESDQQTIRGCSWLAIRDNLITEHRDYWDAAEELYEKLPLIGSLMRFLKKKLRAN